MQKAEHWRRRYGKGARREYTVMAKLKRAGFYCVRSAGSHGIIDIVAFNPNTNIIRIIQVKTYHLSENAKQKILAPLKALEGEYMVEAELQ